MKTFASTILAAALAVAATAPALSCPYQQNKSASLTDNSSYQTAQKDQKDQKSSN